MIGPIPQGIPPSPGGASGTSSSSAASQKSGPARSTLFFYTMQLAANGVPQSCPAYMVPDGAQVQVNAPAGNLKSVYAATYRGAFAGGSMVAPLAAPLNALPLSASFATVFSVANLANIWGWGQQGDSIVVTVTKGV